MNKDDISRDPGDYHMSYHATGRANYRHIDYEMVCETIRDGEIKNSHKENCCLFIKELWYTENPVGVVANYEDGEILTVEWRKE